MINVLVIYFFKFEKDSENCIFLNKLSILRKFNESKLNSCTPHPDDSYSSISTRSCLSSYYDGQGNKRASVFKEYFLLHSEQIIIKEENAIYHHKINKQIEGDLILTNFRIIFNPKILDFFEKEFVLPDYLNVPYMLIHSFNNKKEKIGKNKYHLKLKLKDRPEINIGYDSKVNHKNIDRCFTEYFIQKNVKKYYSFNYFKKYKNVEFFKNENGWTIYQDLIEYSRFGVDTNDKDSQFRIYIQEVKGSLCETYPNNVYIPKKITDNELSKVADFRSKKRFPALVWKCKLNDSCLWRSSQSKSGLYFKRSKEEESFFNLSKENEKFHIYDARHFISALANSVIGMGYENLDNFKNSQIIFCEIENIHKVREAYNKLRCISQLPLEGYDNWLLDLHETNWLQLIAKIIKSSVNIASSILENANVLVHCSDGWDRTTQLSTLSQIILDSYYRTLEGLIVIIEKDWVSFGHQFATRCGHVITSKDDNDTSPIFVQWLDCLHQLISQFPDLFEYNNELLLFISHHVYSCLYGTFLFNTEKDKISHSVKDTTVSIWTDVLKNKKRFTNANFDQNISIKTTLVPSCAFYKLRLWEEYFLRWNPYYVMNNSHKLHSPYL